MIARSQEEKDEQYRMLLACLERSDMVTGGVFVVSLDVDVVGPDVR